jgi:hypothetical protein
MQGLILIPDITGFSNFVNCVNGDLGVSITKDLLNEIINSNPLKIELSEIEGDAILYYKVGNPISLNEIFAAFKIISQAFDNKYKNLKEQYDIKANLSLKFIIHYGNIILFDILGLTKLYGETVIESHRLLKNGCGGSNYILITEDYFSALNQTSSGDHLSDEDFKCNYSDLFTGLRKVGYYFFNYVPTKRSENCLIRA